MLRKSGLLLKAVKNIALDIYDIVKYTNVTSIHKKKGIKTYKSFWESAVTALIRHGKTKYDNFVTITKTFTLYQLFYGCGKVQYKRFRENFRYKSPYDSDMGATT